MLGTSKIFATRPMKVTAFGPGSRSRMSSSAYSVGGCHGSAGLDFRASWISSAVNPSPMTGSELGAGVLDLVGDEIGVGLKKAWMEVSPLLAPPMLLSNVEERMGREAGSEESGKEKTEVAVRRAEAENCLLGTIKVAPSQCVAESMHPVYVLEVASRKYAL